MRIQFLPLYQIDEIVHANSVACEKQYNGISIWKYGQIKNIPDDLKFRVNIEGNVSYVNLVDDLLSDYSFKIVGAKNPNFHCAICGIETLEEALKNPDITIQQGIPLEIDGERVCRDCFQKQIIPSEEI